MPLNAWSGQLGAGRHHIEVVECDEDRSKSKGDLMWKVKLRAVGGFDSIRDVIMLEGAGFDMGIGKLTRLGVTREMLPIDAERIIGRRAYINVAVERYDDPKTGAPKERTKVDGMYIADTEQPPMPVKAEAYTPDQDEPAF